MPRVTIRLAICDDSNPFREILTMVLEREPDIEIVGQAVNGAEGIELARTQRPDAMLLDVAMPVMDGIEAIAGIHEASPGTAVIMLTGMASSVNERGLAAGAVRVIEKGADITVVLEAVRSAVAERTR